MRKELGHRAVVTAAVLFALSVSGVLLGGRSGADPEPADPTNEQPQWPCEFQCLRPDGELVRPLPPIAGTSSDWVPKFPFPYDQTRNRVTEADINAEREMCQWFDANYQTLIDQIDRVQFNRIQQNGPGVRIGSGTDWDYSVEGVQSQVDIVTTNIDQAVGFLAPRALALTQSQDHSGDTFFPLYQGESFFLLWQHLSNVNDGIKAHQPDWFTGPSVQRVKYWGSRIHRSGVCR